MRARAPGAAAKPFQRARGVSVPRPTLAALLVALSLVPVGANQQCQVRVARLELGTTLNGLFVPRPGRTFRAGEVVAVKATVSVETSASCQLRVLGELYHPLGPLLARASSQFIVPSGSWDLYFWFNISEWVPQGYHRVRVKASACGSEASHEAAFFYVSAVSTLNRVELEYALEISGSGRVAKLLLALPNDPSLWLIAGPVINPRPKSVVRDELGNSYALYEDLEVEGMLRITVELWATQRVLFATADAPLSTPPPDEARVFLGASPYIESNHPQIVSLARQLVSNASTYREALARIADFVSASVKYDEGIASLPNYYKLGALWALNARKGACVQLSRLFTALARAAGIPSRIVEGFEVKPPQVIGRRYTHAYVEVYVPGYGWLPVEPQHPGPMVGLTPPLPGRIALVRGSGEVREVAGERSEAGLVLLVYSGSLSASLSYTASIVPHEPLRQRVVLEAQVPTSAYYGDRVTVAPWVLPRGSVCEVSVEGPSSSFASVSRCERPLAIELNDTGDWKVEVFAWKEGFLPAYGAWLITVQPRPLNLSIQVTDAVILRRARITVRTSPPVSGAPVLIEVSSCYFSSTLLATTGHEGEAAVSVGPLLLPCLLRVSASTSPRGYTRAASTQDALIAPSPELILSVALACAVAALLRRRAPRDAASEIPEPGV